MALTKLAQRIQAWLDPLDSLPVECDGMTRVIMALLSENGIKCTTMGGYIAEVKKLNDNGADPNVKGMCNHWWIELPTGHLIDYRARMWMGPGAQHGVFIKNAENFDYFHKEPVDMGSYPIEILSFMVERDLTLHPKLEISSTELKALNNPSQVNSQLNAQSLTH